MKTFDLKAYAPAQPAMVFIGAQLSSVIRDPFPRDPDSAPMHIYAYADPTVRNGRDVTDWFWQAYLERGRCVFDPGHDMYFQGDEQRYHMPNGQIRTCRWCGQTQLAEHRERVVTDTVWEDVA